MNFHDAVLGDRPGVLCVAFGRVPFRDARGRYKHRGWQELGYPWPAGREQLREDVIRELSTGDAVDVFVSPAVRQAGAKSRRQGDALPPLVLWADLDGEPEDTGLLAELNPFVVASGSVGHRHVYVSLARPVDLGTWNRLQRALRNALGGGADSKIADNDLLRLPGTFNWKPTVPPVGGTASPKALVSVESGGGEVWAPAALAAVLGVAMTPAAGTTGTTLTGEPPPDPLPGLVRWALDHPDTGDRSRAHARVVGACLDAHLTLAQAWSVVVGYPPSAAKYGRRVADETTRFWLKALDERQRKMTGQASAARPPTRASLTGILRAVLDAPPEKQPALLGWAEDKLRGYVAAGQLDPTYVTNVIEQLRRGTGGSR